MTPFVLLALALAPEPSAPSPAEGPAPASAAPFEPGPTYPLGPLAVPDFLAPGRPFALTDLRYSMSDDGRAEHAFAARVRCRNVGYLGVEFDRDRQGLSLQAHRLSLDAATENGAWFLGAGWRASRVVVSFDARSSAVGSHRDWVLGPTLSVRLGSDVEAYSWASGNTARPEGRFLTGFGLGAVWQRGSWLEAVGELARRYEVTDAPSENRTDSGRLSAVAQLGPAEATAEASLEDVRGRFPRRESEAAGQLRVPLAGRLLLEGGASGRFDSEAGALRHEYRGALTWFGRRFTLPRAGSAAAQAVSLARRATDGGEYELRAFDDPALRAQRERLSLSPRAAEYREAMEAVYRAQVEERSVPLLGVEVRQSEDVLTGERTFSARALAGVPWPPAWPWQGREAAVPFLRLDVEHERITTATRFRSDVDRVALTVSLNRDMDLALRWERTEPTALDLVRGIGERRTFAVSCVYARGR
jgi:hypothetical protein